jgi:quercetin dioxygenase-like cupin family protein
VKKEGYKMKLIKVNSLPGTMPPGHYDLIGRKIIDLDLGSKAMRTYLIHMDSNGRTDPHTHTDAEQLFFVLKGELSIKGKEGEELRVKEGEAAFVPAGDPHLISNGIEGKTDYLAITSNFKP